VNLNVVYGAIFIFSAIKWGDWKNWRLYYPTYLFLMVGDLVYQFLFFKHSMWEYVPYGSDVNWATHTHIAFLIMLVKYPATILIFLGKMPTTLSKKIIHILVWSLIYVINEFTDLKIGTIIHDHGWNLWWSAFFNLVMFTTLAIHYKKPLVAWVISFIYATFLWNVFDISPDILK
jgi:hypothetical protein